MIDREDLEIRIIEMLSGNVADEERACLMVEIANDESLQHFYNEMQIAIGCIGASLNTEDIQAARPDWKLPPQIRAEVEALCQESDDENASNFNMASEDEYLESCMIEMLSGDFDGFDKADLLATIKRDPRAQSTFTGIQGVLGLIEASLDTEEIKAAKPDWKLSAERRVEIEAFCAEETAVQSSASRRNHRSVIKVWVGGAVAASLLFAAGIYYQYSKVSDVGLTQTLPLVADNKIKTEQPIASLQSTGTLAKQVGQPTLVSIVGRENKIAEEKKADAESLMVKVKPQVLTAKARPKTLIKVEENCYEVAGKQFVPVSRIVSEKLNQQFQTGISVLRQQQKTLAEIDRELRNQNDAGKLKSLAAKRAQLKHSLARNNQYAIEKFGYSLQRNYLSIIEDSHVYRLSTAAELAQLKVDQPDRNWSALVREEEGRLYILTHTIRGEQENKLFRGYTAQVISQLKERGDCQRILSQIQAGTSTEYVDKASQLVFISRYNELEDSIKAGEAFLRSNFGITTQGGYIRSVVNSKLYTEVNSQELARLSHEGAAVLYSNKISAI